jgi:adenosylhomocysteinase
MNARLDTPVFSDCAIADLSLADWGRKEIRIAETEMPGLMAIREEFAKQPLKGARITGSLHMTIQTAVLIETLQALGAQVRWASATSSPRRTMPPPPLPPAARRCSPQGRDAGRLLGLHPPHLRLRPQGLSEGEGPNMILDDGGDATLLMHLGKPVPRRTSRCWPSHSEEERCLFASIKAKLASRTRPGTAARPEEIIGVTEETTTGVHRLKEMSAKGTLLFRAINVNDSVTKSKFDNLYGCRESLVDASSAPPT